MARLLKMPTVQEILSLHADGYSQRAIARQLGCSRDAVSRYLRLAQAEPLPASAPTGSTAAESAPAAEEPVGASNQASAPTGSIASLPPAITAFQAKARRRRTASSCAPYHDLIITKLEQGLSAQRIYQDLVEAQGFSASYWSVRRYVQRLSGRSELPVRRLEVLAGAEAQVDFGTGAPLVDANGKRKKTHVFRIVMSHSRKGYSEATLRQTTDDFLTALENAFRHFGGVPKTLVIDNLKAAVQHPDWFDPELTPKVAAFARHYGTVILPTRPRKPQHKGKIEAGIKYVQNNGLKGRTFKSLAEENQHLAHWEQQIADTRIHGTTKRQVGKLFAEVERGALKPLPPQPFANFQEAQRKVNRDGHVEVAKAYYSVPPEYLGRTVWVRWDARLVRVFNRRWEQIALHVRHEPGRFSTQATHLAREKIHGLEKGVAYLLQKASNIGPETKKWADAMLHARGIEGTRVLQGLLSLAKKHAADSLENACKMALSHGEYRLRTLRKLLAHQGPAQEPLPFLDEHPIIRPLEDYAALVTRALHRQESRPSVGEGLPRHGSGVREVHEKSLDAVSDQGSSTSSTRPRSGYPLLGCTSAEPNAVSPDNSTLVRPSSPDQESPP
jgi:transposase